MNRTLYAWVIIDTFYMEHGEHKFLRTVTTKKICSVESGLFGLSTTRSYFIYRKQKGSSSIIFRNFLCFT